MLNLNNQNITMEELLRLKKELEEKIKAQRDALKSSMDAVVEKLINAIKDEELPVKNAIFTVSIENGEITGKWRIGTINPRTKKYIIVKMKDGKEVVSERYTDLYSKITGEPIDSSKNYRNIILSEKFQKAHNIESISYREVQNNENTEMLKDN